MQRDILCEVYAVLFKYTILRLIMNKGDILFGEKHVPEKAHIKTIITADLEPEE